MEFEENSEWKYHLWLMFAVFVLFVALHCNDADFESFVQITHSFIEQMSS